MVSTLYTVRWQTSLVPESVPLMTYSAGFWHPGHTCNLLLLHSEIMPAISLALCARYSEIVTLMRLRRGISRSTYNAGSTEGHLW
jgi:hypothetical protein